MAKNPNATKVASKPGYNPLWDSESFGGITLMMGKKNWAQPFDGSEPSKEVEHEAVLFLEKAANGEFDGQNPEALLTKVMEVIADRTKEEQEVALHRWSIPLFCVETAKVAMDCIQKGKDIPDWIRLETVAFFGQYGAQPNLICWDTRKGRGQKKKGQRKDGAVAL